MKISRKYYFHCLLFVLCTGLSYGQQNKIDSLLKILPTKKEDTVKVALLNEAAWILKDSDPDTAIILSNQALESATNLEWKKGRALSINQLGTFNLMKGDYEKALRFYFESFRLHKEINNKSGMAACLCNIGIVYDEQGNYPTALDYYIKAMKLDEEIKDKKRLTGVLVNIGLVYYVEKNNAKALEYYMRALAIAEEQKNKNYISPILSNIGMVYHEQKNYSKGRSYYFKGLQNAQTLNDQSSMATELGNIGNTYRGQGDSALSANNEAYAQKEIYPKASDYYFKALKISEEIGDLNSVATWRGNIGALFTYLNKYKESRQYLFNALHLADSLGILDVVKTHYQSLSNLYQWSDIPLQDSAGKKLLGIHEMRTLALYYYKRYIACRDSIFNEANSRQLLQKELDYDFEKKKAVADAEHNLEMQKQQVIADEKSRRQNIIIGLVAAGLILVLVFAGFILRTLRVTKKQRDLIDEQKKEVEEQKKIVESQKDLVQEKQKEIIDSIQYAKRIQHALITPENYINKKLNELQG